jgi:hypothetical protein
MPILVVRSKSADCRYRAGQRFSREDSIVDASDEQAAAIRADDLLIVSGAPAVAVEPQEEISPSPKAKR